MLNFEKVGYTFNFTNPELDRFGKLVFDYIITDSKTGNIVKKGCNAEFLADKDAIKFLVEVKLNGKNCGGVGLFPADLEKVLELNTKLKAERASEIEIIVNNIVSGTHKIEFGKVGCDYVHYQGWLRNIPNYLEAQKLMELAAIKVIGEKYISGSICDFLEKCAEKIYGKAFTWIELGDKFEIDMVSLVIPLMDAKKKKEEIEQKRIDDLFEIAKQTGIAQEISHYLCGCNDKREACDVDIVTTYAMPDGTVKTERHHTW